MDALVDSMRREENDQDRYHFTSHIYNCNGFVEHVIAAVVITNPVQKIRQPPFISKLVDNIFYQFNSPDVVLSTLVLCENIKQLAQWKTFFENAGICVVLDDEKEIPRDSIYITIKKPSLLFFVRCFSFKHTSVKACINWKFRDSFERGCFYISHFLQFKVVVSKDSVYLARKPKEEKWIRVTCELSSDPNTICISANQYDKYSHCHFGDVTTLLAYDDYFFKKFLSNLMFMRTKPLTIVVPDGGTATFFITQYKYSLSSLECCFSCNEQLE